MHPILIKIGPVTIHTYGFLLAVGVLLAFFLSLKLAKRENLDTRVVSDFFVYAIIVGLIGAKLFLFVTEFGYYMRNPGQIPSLITSAGTFYGGLIFGALFVVWYVRKSKLNLRTVADIVAPPIALAHFFGRMGCFTAGCCWGRAAEGCPIAVEFTDTHSAIGEVFLGHSLYPTQIIEAFLNLLNFIVLIIFYKKKKFTGQVFVLYLFNYSIIRFFVEFFRGDDDRGYVFGGMEHPFTSLSVPQLISITGIVVAVILYKKFKKADLAAKDTQDTKKKKRK